MNAPRRVDLRKTEIALRRKLDGILHGDRLAIRKGEGYEPSDPRLYDYSSDDAKRIDWPLSNRFGELWMRRTEPDRELHTTFIVDMSARMFIGTGVQEKRVTAISVVWSLALLLNGGSNKVSALISHNEDRRSKWYQPMSGQRNRLNIVSYLKSIRMEDSGEVQLGKLIKVAFKRLRRPGQLVIIVSDFLSPGWEKVLRRLARKHTVYCIRVIDKWDLELKDEGWIILEDAVTGEIEEINTSDSDTRDTVRSATETQRQTIRKTIIGSEAGYVELRTDGKWATELIAQTNSTQNQPRRGRRAA